MVNYKEVSEFKIPGGVNFTLADGELKASGKLGEARRTFKDNYVRIKLGDGKIVLEISKESRRNNAIVGTWLSEVKNMAEGVSKGFEYEMKIDYTHFPMRVSVKGNNVEIDNFLGERSPRKAKILGSSKVNIKGDRVFISGIDKRDIGGTAANIERATKIKGFDLRVFQDGIYLLKGVEIDA